MNNEKLIKEVSKIPQIETQLDSIEQKIFGTVNVMFFGAKGDGVTDDTKAIQDAIDSLQKGGRVFIPQGKYKIKGLKITHSILIEGCGFATGEVLGDLDEQRNNYVGTTLLFEETNGVAIDINADDIVSPLAGIQVKNLRIEGNREVVGATAGIGIRMKCGSKNPVNLSTMFINSCHFENLTVSNFKSYGQLLIGPVFQIQHSSCFFVRNGLAQIRHERDTLQLKSPSEVKYIGCIFDSEAETTENAPLTANGIELDVTSDGAKFMYCTIQQCEIGFYMQQNAQAQFVLYGCHFEVNKTAIQQSGSGSLYVEKCYYALNQRDYFVNVANGTAYLKNNIFSGTEYYVNVGGFSKVVVEGRQILSKYGTKFKDDYTKGWLELRDTYRQTFKTLTSASNVAVNCEEGEIFALTLTSNTTLNITNPFLGLKITLRLVQNVTGNWVVTFPSTCKFAGGSYVVTPTPQKADTITLFWNGANWIEESRVQNL